MSEVKELQRTWTEAPASATVKAHYAGREWMLTVRDDSVSGLIGKVETFSKWLDSHAEQMINAEAPKSPAPMQAPAPVVTQQAAGPLVAQCVMIEIGTSYQGGKTQLKFNCNGIEHPLTYTREIGDMVKLLAPLGFTAAHIVVGQKYPVSCRVTYHENSKDGKTYKNVDRVEAA